MSIAIALIETVRAEAKSRARARVRHVGLKIGELAGIDPEALAFSFEVLVRGTELFNVELQIQLCPRRHRCMGCGETFTVQNYELQCPRCGEASTAYVSGDELELAYIEVEDHEPGALAAQSPQ